MLHRSLCDAGGSWHAARRHEYLASCLAKESAFDKYARHYECQGRAGRHFTGCVNEQSIVEAMQAAGARSLWFVGDSVLMQVAFVASCMARTAEGGRGWAWSRPRWANHFPKNEKAAGGVNCAVSARVAPRQTAPAQICFLTAVGHNRSPTLAQALEVLVALNLTRSSDVAMVTPGAWRVENATQHATIVGGLARFMARASPLLGNRPRVLYQEPLAAHFPTEHGWFAPDLPLPTRCVPFSTSRTHPAAALPPAHEAARDILRDAQLAQSAPSRFASLDGAWAWSAGVAIEAHPGSVCREHDHYCTSDCTHWCVRSGVAEALVDALVRRLLHEWRK